MKHPQRLGKYTITGVIGEGAMGVVYKAFDPDIARPVAIKTIHKRLVHDDDSPDSFTARFRNEAHAVGRLSHPGIVAIYEYGEDADTAYIAMEFVEGHNLSQILAQTPLPGEAAVLRVMDQLLAALDCAHGAGVWHRDIKPANLIVNTVGQLKVTDFGIARVENQVLTQLSSVLGTPGYTAPEHYMGHALDQRVDIFAAGVLLYRMLAGSAPFAGTPEAAMYKIVHVNPPPPSQVAAGRRPDRFDAVVAKALAKRPDERYASAAQFRQALLQAAGANAPLGFDTTLSLPRAGASAPASVAATRADTTPSGGTLLSATSISGWDTRRLAPMELALAELVGPMAKLLVRQAARHCTDIASLAARVAEHIPDSKDRGSFLARVATTSGRTRPQATATSTPTATTSPPLTDPGGLLPATVVGHALRVLTSHIGPIARVVVKQAALKAPSTEAFYVLLAEQAPQGIDRNGLLTRLRSRTE